MNRREMLKCTIGGVATLSLPSMLFAQPIKQPTWFTRQQLLKLFKQLDGQTTRETVDMVDPRFWNGRSLETWEAVHIAMTRMCNIMHRKTLDYQSKHWLIVSPATCRSKYWPGYVFGTYSTPGKMGGVWIEYPWYKSIKDEVAPGVHEVGWLNGKWQFYVCEGFPDNKIMLGMGYKEVIHFRRGAMKRYEWGECPEFIPYMAKPTRKNYAIITLKDSLDS